MVGVWSIKPVILNAEIQIGPALRGLRNQPWEFRCKGYLFSMPTTSRNRGIYKVYWQQFAIEVLLVIGLSPCQPDHTFESSTTIKMITMQIVWLSSSLWKVRDPVTKELHNHFDDELLIKIEWHEVAVLFIIQLTAQQLTVRALELSHIEQSIIYYL